ncbi:MAG: choloylglycine hydrolase family protein [Lachnospiraceae bacterium]|nr:choloylglycine hydrolase family protein [Lachnospiraceae bacterium]
MCTSIAMKTNDFYFGRTMDLEYNFNECVVFTPRNYPVPFRKMGMMKRHYALLGMATVMNGFPLYAEAANEKGLCIAGLNFPDNAYYPPDEKENCSNISPFELILWLLGKCASVQEAKELLATTHFIHIPFNSDTPLAPLHWHIADRESSFVLELTKDGTGVFDNPLGVLTNNPAFPFQLTNSCQYMNLTANTPSNCFSVDVGLKPFGQGLGSFGLPGDFSPASRFVKASYLALNSVCEEDEQSSIAQFFHLLDSVSMVRGSVVTKENRYDLTLYSCCINADKGIYYYKTYSNNQLSAVCMGRENLNGCKIKKFPLRTTQQIAWMN